jgi:hypothetical protein
MATRGRTLVVAALKGAASGLAGVAGMTIGEQVEQALTKRPDSFVPARALRALAGRRSSEGPQSPVWNHAMHWGTGALLGTLRGVWSAVGMRGASATAMFGVVRLAFDQTVENTTGVGAPPTSWPRREVAVDLLHKAVYAVGTSLVADAIIRPVLSRRRGATSH